MQWTPCSHFHLPLLSIKQRGGVEVFFSCVQRRPVAEQIFFFFFLRETITLFIENKCWHLEGAAAGERKGGWEREAGPLCALESASGAIWQQCWVLGGSPPENKACISINQLLMKAFGLKKRELARGYNVHGFHIGSSQWSKKVNGKGERNISALGLCRSKPEHLIQTKKKTTIAPKKLSFRLTLKTPLTVWHHSPQSTPWIYVTKTPVSLKSWANRVLGGFTLLPHPWWQANITSSDWGGRWEEERRRERKVKGGPSRFGQHSSSNSTGKWRISF